MSPIDPDLMKYFTIVSDIFVTPGSGISELNEFEF